MKRLGKLPIDSRPGNFGFGLAGLSLSTPSAQAQGVMPQTLNFGGAGDVR